MLEVWKEVLLLLHMQAEWRGFTLDEAFLHWWKSDANKDYRAVPFIISWELWISRNDSIFKDITKTLAEIMITVVGIIVFYLT